MHLDLLLPAKTLSKAYLRQPLTRPALNNFNTQLLQMMEHAEAAEKNHESEEHFKNIFKDFLKKTWYDTSGNYINTAGRTDLVIHNEKTSSSDPAVLIEVKKPGNRGEMVSKGKPNTKAIA